MTQDSVNKILDLIDVYAVHLTVAKIKRQAWQAIVELQDGIEGDSAALNVEASESLTAALQTHREICDLLSRSLP
jgi:hypothetical protein